MNRKNVTVGSLAVVTAVVMAWVARVVRIKKGYGR